MTGCDSWIGKRLGKFQILRALGKGGMGVVYEAEDTRLQRPVALKLLPESLARDDAILKRFLLEARAAARLSHPNVVAVYDIGQRDGTYYLAMELVRGVNLQFVLARHGALPWAIATKVCAGVCQGLVAAHAAGLIHRDVKPSNILVTGIGGLESGIKDAGLPVFSQGPNAWPPNFTAKIADFGLAKFSTQNFPRLTAVNSTVGTPAYMSPEQCRTEPVDALSDLYSLGATYFALLVGRPPYGNDNDMDTLAAHCMGVIPDPRQYRPEIPAACAAVAMRAMGKGRNDRFAGAEEMLAALTAAPTASHRSLPMPPALSYPPIGNVDSQVKTQFIRPTPPDTAPHRAWHRLALLAVPLLLVPALACTGLASLIWWRSGAEVPAGDPQPVAAEPPAIKDGAAKLEMPGDAIELRPLRRLDGHSTAIVGLAFHPSNKRVISAGDLSVRVWDVDTGVSKEPITHKKKLTAMALFPEGDKLAVATADRRVFIWTLAAVESRGFGPLRNDVVSMAISPDGALLAIGTGGDMEVWDVAGPFQRKYVYPKTQLHVTAVAFSGDGKLLAWVNKQREVHVVETTQWQAGADAFNQPGELSCVAFTVDGQCVIFGGREADGARGVLRRWNFATDGEQPRPLLLEKAGLVRTLALLGGGRNMVFGGEWGGPLRVLDLKAESTRPAAAVGQTSLQVLAVSPDGRLLAGGMESGAIQLWEVVKKGP